MSIKIGFWTNSFTSMHKSGVQYNNERLINILVDAQIYDVVKIAAKTNTLISYFANLLFLNTRKDIRDCDYLIYDGFMPIFGSQKKIGIVNDLMTVNGQVKNGIKRRVVMGIYFLVLKFLATKIISISNTTSDELVKKYRISKKKIVIIPPVIIDPPVGLLKGKKKMSSKIRLIYVGAIRSNKNLETLLQAVRIIKESDVLVHLSIVGPFKSYDITNINGCLSKYSIRDYTTIYSNVTNIEKYEIMNNSDCLVLPSFQEGFGMPCIEAFSIGLPVICSNIPVLVEITRQKATYFDPYSPDDLAKEILRINDINHSYGELQDVWKMYSHDSTKEKFLNLFRSR